MDEIASLIAELAARAAQNRAAQRRAAAAQAGAAFFGAGPLGDATATAAAKDAAATAARNAAAVPVPVSTVRAMAPAPSAPDPPPMDSPGDIFSLETGSGAAPFAPSAPLLASFAAGDGLLGAIIVSEALAKPIALRDEARF